jgi:hypothetical protein
MLIVAQVVERCDGNVRYKLRFMQEQRGSDTSVGWLSRRKKVCPVPGWEKNALDIPFHRTGLLGTVEI